MTARALLGRLLQSAITLAVIAALVWLMFRAIPGDPTTVYLGTGQLSADAAAAMRKQWGLDDPLWQQFLRYLGNVAQGDFGISFHYRRPVGEILLPALGNTVLLLAPAIALATVAGIGIGAWLGWQRGRRTEALGSLAVLIPRAMPAFWIGMIVLYVFAYRLGWFPIGGIRTAGFYPETWIERLPGYDLLLHLALPVLAAFIYYIADPLLIMRTSMTDVKHEDFIAYARSRGLTERQVRGMARRNALLPVVNYVGIMIGFAFGGQVLLEVVFSWPGMGRLMVAAVVDRDYPLAQAAFLLMAAIVIVVNLLVDIVSPRLDPRLRDG